MERKIKMIGLDLDGTLLTTKKELLPYTRDVLQRAVDQGIVVLIATGRPWMGVPEVMRHYPGMEYCLTSNGARIVKTRTGEPVEEKLLDRDLAVQALDICRKYDTLCEAYYGGQGYANEEDMERVTRYHHDPNMWHYFRTTRVPVPDVYRMVCEANRPADKLQALFADTEEIKIAWKELEDTGAYQLVGSLKYNIEINARGVNKGDGLVRLGKRLGIRREEIMACGDGDNDSTMLKEVGFGVAMANAVEQTKAAADYITLTNDEEGAARAIEKFALRSDKAEGSRLC